ncbi:MAG: hypothetical protein ACI823_000875 [Chitinophagales bacterium]|jgi:hypothetical protein
MRFIIIFMLFGCLLSTNLWADHEPDHRYNVRGYVLDANQRGTGNLMVQVFSDGEALGSTLTNADGYYSLLLHLHDADYLRVLKLRAGPHEAELKVTFDVSDVTSERIHEANFIDGKYVEGAIGGFRVPSWSYAVGGLLLIILIAIFLEKRRKKKIRLAKYGPSDNHSPSKHKVRKARRKHH